MIKFTVELHFMSTKHKLTLVLLYDKDIQNEVCISSHFVPLQLQLDHVKLLDVRTSLPESHAIVLLVVWFVMSLPENHATCI